MPPYLPLTALAMLTIASVGCSSTGPVVPAESRAPVLYEWYDDGVGDPVRIVINLTEQRASYHRGQRSIGWSFVATGTEGRRTPAGDYHITEKIVDKYSNRYGWIENEFGQVIDSDASPGDSVPPDCRYVAAPMPYWMRLTSYGIGMHGGIIPQPGEPASHGCIRLPRGLVPILFNHVKVGTEVRINP